MNYSQSLDRAMHLCSRQEKCSSDILAKLKEWGADETTAQKVLQVLTEKKFVDDLRYAKAYTRQQHTFRKWGRIKIRTVLKQKNIPADFIDKALAELNEQDYRETLKAELLKKRRGIKAKNRYDLLARLQKFAYGRGYEPEMAREVAEEISDEDPPPSR